MARSYRFFVTQIEDFEKDVSLSGSHEPEIVEQLGKVLRVKAGDEVILLPTTSNGFEYVYRVENAHKKGVDLVFLHKVANSHELPFELELVVCLPNKPDKLSLILQKAVELGVSGVMLLDGDFSQMKHGLREERLHKIMKEAAEQAERATVPDVVVGGALRDYLGRVEGGLLVAMERAENPGLIQAVRAVREKLGADTKILILVGPEGGFSDEEKSLIQEKGFTCFSLGNRILRMETAAIVALGIVSLCE